MGDKIKSPDFVGGENYFFLKFMSLKITGLKMMFDKSSNTKLSPTKKMIRYAAMFIPASEAKDFTVSRKKRKHPPIKMPVFTTGQTIAETITAAYLFFFSSALFATDKIYPSLVVNLTPSRANTSS